MSIATLKYDGQKGDEEDEESKELDNRSIFRCTEISTSDSLARRMTDELEADSDRGWEHSVYDKVRSAAVSSDQAECRGKSSLNKRFGRPKSQ